MNTQIKLQGLKEGLTVITSTSKEEMELINAIVDAELGNDIIKERISDNVFSWKLKSATESIEKVITELKEKGIEVRSAIDNNMGSKNTMYYVKAKDVEGLNLNIKFNKNRLLTKTEGHVDILDIIPQ